MPPYNFHEMQPGDTFAIAVNPDNRDPKGRLKDLLSVRSAASHYSRRNGVKLVVRKVSQTEGVCERIS